MKKIISLLLVLVMCIGVFAGCSQGGDTTTAGTASGLDGVILYLKNMYRDTEGKETAVSYTVISTVPSGGKNYDIEWSIKSVTGDASQIVTVEKGEKMTTINVEKNHTDAVIEYELVATVKEGDETKSVSFKHTVSVAAPIAEVADGTYVISAAGLSLAALGETYTYGYPTANPVSEKDYTAADVVTITNVAGGVTIQDCYGRYLYLKGTYNSFNLSAEMPEEGHIFELQFNDDGSYALVNVTMQKTLAYSTSYSSWGCYDELTADRNSSLSIFAADLGNAHVHTEETIPGKAATCTEDGLTDGVKCSECGAILTEQQTIKAAHTWGEWEVTKEATATAEGEKVRTCSVCGEKDTKVIDKVDDGTTEKKVVLVNQGSYVTSIDSPYTSSSGTVKNQLAMSADKAEAMELTVRENSDGTVTFVTADGKFLLADGTHVQLVDTEGDNTLFVLVETDGGYFIKCANATYNNNPQYLEVYSEKLTCYGMNESNTAIYTFTMETVGETGGEEPAEGLKVDTAYIFGMYQGNKGETYYLVGGMNGYYMETTADAAAALKVYFETVDGGYYMYCYEDGTKTYINMVVSGEHVNGKYDTTASTVYTYDAERNTVVAVVNDAEYVFGTNNSKTYTTVGPVKVSYEPFTCVLTEA